MIEKLDPANLGVGPDDETIAKINELVDAVNWGAALVVALELQGGPTA